MDDCVFCKIINGEIPCKKYYEDELMIVIEDISPRAKKHFLAIPKKHYKYFNQMTDADAAELAACIKKIGELAPTLGLENGFRFIVNQGDDALQTVPHLHMHLMGGQKLGINDYRRDD